jgi:uncharacterized membrane protein
MKKRVADQIAWTVALLLSGVAAGMFLMDCFGYYPLLPRLADHAAIQLHQESLPLHRGLFQMAILSSGVACLVMIVFFSERTSRGLLIASLTCLIALVVYTNYALIPLNQEIGTWTPDAPPAGWKTLFSEMIFREQLRSALPVIAFVLELTASGRRASSPDVPAPQVRGVRSQDAFLVSPSSCHTV